MKSEVAKWVSGMATSGEAPDAVVTTVAALEARLKRLREATA